MTHFNEFIISRILEKWIIYLWANSESKIVMLLVNRDYINSWNREFIKLCREQHIRKKILLFYISRIPILFIAFYIVSIYSSIYLRNPAWLVSVFCVCVFVCLYFGQKAWWWPDLAPKLNMRYKSEKPLTFFDEKKNIKQKK